jgi:hypothetical protein
MSVCCLAADIFFILFKESNPLNSTKLFLTFNCGIIKISFDGSNSAHYQRLAVGH